MKRYALVLVIVAVAVALRMWLDPHVGAQSVGVFLGAILIGAWCGGLGPALLCIVLLHVVHAYWFHRPPGLWDGTVAMLFAVGGYYLVGITVGLLSQMRASAHQRAQAEHAEALSQREHLRATLSCVADGVLVTDVNGRVTLMNRAAEALTGWKMADAKGQPWREILAIRREDREAGDDDPIDRALHEGRIVHERTPLVLTSRTGQSMPIAYSAAPVQPLDGPVSGVVFIFRDESERRRTELALQNADRRKDDFLATLAHELRNPLAPISMGLELLRVSADDPQGAEEVRAMMQRQTQHMVRLIDDLLDVSRITRGKLELRKAPVALADVVRDAVAATRPWLDDAQHQFTVRLPEQAVLLDADASRLTQVLTNLLNNAAKYTPKGGNIELAAERVGSEVAISVSDSGIGIPSDKLDGVFEMFSQIHEGSEYGHSGLGIGLALVKRLVEMHGGSVEVRSKGKDLGTTFVVRLPTLAEPPVALNGGQHELQKGRVALGRRILVVDDNADVLESLSRLIELMGHEVRQAHDGWEALEIARTFRPDVVLMDLGMPNLNGYDAARHMRGEPWGRDVALVATTGWGQEDDRQRTAAAGFDRHMVKPVALAALREVLDAPLRSREASPASASNAAST